MYNLNLFSNYDVAEYRKEGEDGGEGGFAVDDEEWHMVDLQAIREISYAGPFFVCVGDDYNLVSAINELRRKLIDMTFNTSWLGKEEVADHGNIVRHGGIGIAVDQLRIEEGVRKSSLLLLT
jgi:hypothetical protein